MNCVEAERLFDAYLDGELSGALRLELDAHRLRCSICQQKLAMMDACEHIIGTDPRGPRLSADFTDRVMAAVSDKAQVMAETRRRQRWMIGAAVALQAAAVVGAIVFWPALTGRGTTPRQPAMHVATTTSTWEKEVETAIAQRNETRLSEMIWERYGDLKAARDTISNDVGALSKYAAGLAEPARQARATSVDPLFWILGLFGPQADDAAAANDDPDSL